MARSPVQKVKRKGLKYVDKMIYLLLTGYVMIVGFYVVFEIVKINFSPLSVKDDLHASYPSSHSFIFMALMLINMCGLLYYVKVNKVLKIVILATVIVLCFAMCVIRFLSGHHYFTDIIGAILLSAFIWATFNSISKYILVEPNGEE